MSRYTSPAQKSRPGPSAFFGWLSSLHTEPTSIAPSPPSSATGGGGLVSAAAARMLGRTPSAAHSALYRDRICRSCRGISSAADAGSAGAGFARGKRPMRSRRAFVCCAARLRACARQLMLTSQGWGEGGGRTRRRARAPATRARCPRRSRAPPTSRSPFRARARGPR